MSLQETIFMIDSFFVGTTKVRKCLEKLNTRSDVSMAL